MPVIRIPDSLYERLQKLAVPFIDSPATVIERLMDVNESSDSPAKVSRPDRSPAQKESQDALIGEDNPWAGGGAPLADGSTEVTVPDRLKDKVVSVRRVLIDADPKVSVTKTGKCQVQCWGDRLTGIIRALAVHEFDKDQVRLIVTVLVECDEDAVVHEGTITTQYNVGRRIKAGKPPDEGVHGGGSYCDIPTSTLKALKAAFR